MKHFDINVTFISAADKVPNFLWTFLLYLELQKSLLEIYVTGILNLARKFPARAPTSHSIARLSFSSSVKFAPSPPPPPPPHELT